MNRRKLFKGLAAIAAVLSVPRLAPAENLADIVIRELNTGLLQVIGMVGSVNVGVNTKKLRACLSKNGRLVLMQQFSGETWYDGSWSFVRNVQVFDFDEFQRLLDNTDLPYLVLENKGWMSLGRWLRDTRGVPINGLWHISKADVYLRTSTELVGN